jgi:hypothetical protein
MRSWILALVLGAVAAPACAAVCAPERMVRIITHDATPRDPGPAASTKSQTFYRLGSRYARLEQTSDAAPTPQTLVVIAEPDIWFVNLSDKTGRHVVDPGPTFDVHVALLSGRDLPPAFLELELGCEGEFVQAHAPGSAGRAKIGGRDVELHRVISGDHVIEIAMVAGRPVQVSYLRAGKLVAATAYDRYETGLAPDLSLFAPPAGIAFEEGRP